MDKENFVLQRYIEKQAIATAFVSNSEILNTKKLIVVIPSRNETALLDTLISLSQNNFEDWDTIAVLCLINFEEHITNSNEIDSKQLIDTLHEFKAKLPYQLFPIGPIAMDQKTGGVGKARKLLMDEAVRIFFSQSNWNGIIVNLDADCLVANNYLTIILGHYNQSNAKPAVCLGFKHRYEFLSQAEIQAGKIYEYHLLRYIELQKKYNYPFAFQTLGSCFAVRALEYCQQGGMNQRKAGEDFYFLHKFSILDQLGEISVEIVLPLARSSDRVPFGTGKAISQIIQGKKWTTYNEEAIQLFIQASQWFSTQENIKLIKPSYIPDALLRFLIDSGLETEITRCLRNTSNQDNFRKQVLRFFSPFILMKWLHFARENGYPDDEIPLNLN